MPYPIAKLYQCTSDPKRFKKSYTQVGTISGYPITYNRPLNITDPIFRFSKDISSLNFNYIFIPDLDGRNYWVRKAPTFREGFWEVECHVDVIETWINQIKEISGIVKRTGYNTNQNGRQFINQFLSDDKFKAYQAPAIRTIGF